MNRNTALQKIKKCLALAASNNPHEAAAAMRQAQKLMSHFQISEVDVCVAEISETPAKARNVQPVNWEVSLAQTVAKAFDCEVYGSLSSFYNTNARLFRERNYIFAGVGPASEVAAYAFSVLSRQCVKDRKIHMALQPKNCKKSTLTARGDAYAQGWVLGIQDAIMAFSGNQNNQKIVGRYTKSRHGNTGTIQLADRIKGKNTKRTDWIHGMQAGNQVKLNRGIASATEHQLAIAQS